MVLVTAAMKAELQGFFRQDIKTSRMAAYALGTGETASTAVLQQLLEQYTPEAVIHLGICASIDQDMPLGSAFMPDWAAREASPDDTVGFDSKQGELFSHVLVQVLRGVRLCRGGGMLTGETFFTQKMKQEISRDSRFAAFRGADMESAGLARCCADMHIPLVVAKAVSDDLHSPGPKRLARFIDRWSGMFAEACYLYLGAI